MDHRVARVYSCPRRLWCWTALGSVRPGGCAWRRGNRRERPNVVLTEPALQPANNDGRRAVVWWPPFRPEVPVCLSCPGHHGSPVPTPSQYADERRCTYVVAGALCTVAPSLDGALSGDAALCPSKTTIPPFFGRCRADEGSRTFIVHV